MKKPWLAFLLNFIVAGAGIAYLGKWAWAAINLVATIALGSLLHYFAPDSDSFSLSGIPVVNGVLAMSIAEQLNAAHALQSVAAQPSGPSAKP